MESLVPILNKLEKVTNTVGGDGINIPRIVVVGSQGSGKSSVLENVVGRSFLPKGTGVVTRTPLVLNLVHSPREPGAQRRQEDGTLDAEEYGVFGHADAIFTDFDEICSEIQRRTEKIAGKNKRISDAKITLNLYSPRLPNLTLVDLPGLTKFPVGDQPQDVETRVRNLVLKYIQNPNAIVMALVPANTDMATNESLKLAKECDPEGRRTVAVLTKVDLMDAGTDATDVLEGKVVPVKQEVVAVVSRSQKDVDDQKPIAEVLMDEAEFLRSKYPSLAECNGTAYLVTTLRKLLMERISDLLADVSRRVELKILQAEALVDFYSDDDEEIDRGLMKIITMFSSAYREKIMRLFKATLDKFTTELNNIKPHFTDGLLSFYVKHTIHSHPDEILEHLLSPEIEHTQKPSLGCAIDVFQEMTNDLYKCAYQKDLLIEKFPYLSSNILTVIECLLRTKRSLAEKVIRDEKFLELSRKVINIQRFGKNGKAINAEEFKKGSDETKCAIIMKYFPSYWETLLETVYNDVTVKVRKYLVKEVADKVHDELVEEFSTPGTGRIFRGHQNYSEERKKEQKTLEALHEARDIISQLEENC